jgi:hypothetical protein
MTFAKNLLLLAAFGFAVIGLGFLLIPVQWASLVDISLPTALARIDFRATYGGFNLAIGVFLARCASRPEWLRPGLVALALSGAGYGGGRLVGIVVEHSSNGLLTVFLTLELTIVSLSLYALRRLKRVQRA